MKSTLSASLLDKLTHLDTPTVCNAIEKLQYRLRNEGYIDSKLVKRTSHTNAMVGYAVTLKMRTASPPIKGQSYKDRDDWWDSILSIPAPRVLVIQDLDNPPGTGSVMGAIHAEVFKALGCIGIITNGAVRDIDSLTKGEMQIFSTTVCPSHAYAHIIDVEQPVTLSGITFKPGDLVHADNNGITTIPKASAEEVILLSEQILKHEKAVVQFCHSKEFALPTLKHLLTKME